MSSSAGVTTACAKSLVDHMTPTSRNNASSDGPGNVFESERCAPRARPRARFFCMRTSFALNAWAEAMGYVCESENICGERPVMREKDGVGGAAAYRTWSINTEQSV